ncbi:MAG TPA: hypothetical protein VHS54_03770 [Jatrophihabitans sp.]|jgi:hypothetical protein|nr:hypothetical protein [Jatrophihabitans sp.]
MTTARAPQRDASAESAALDRVVEQLASGLPAVPADDITDAVNVEYERFDGSTIRDFIPILVERRVRDRLGRKPAADRQA